jgi:hypothetical protein
LHKGVLVSLPASSNFSIAISGPAPALRPQWLHAVRPLCPEEGVAGLVGCGSTLGTLSAHRSASQQLNGIWPAFRSLAAARGAPLRNQGGAAGLVGGNRGEKPKPRSAKEQRNGIWPAFRSLAAARRCASKQPGRRGGTCRVAPVSPLEVSATAGFRAASICRPEALHARRAGSSRVAFTCSG